MAAVVRKWSAISATDSSTAVAGWGCKRLHLLSAHASLLLLSPVCLLSLAGIKAGMVKAEEGQQKAEQMEPCGGRSVFSIPS